MNTDFFKNIDTEEKAYWLGFLYADGCVSNNLKHIIVDLSIKDKEHIYKLSKTISCNNKIVVHGNNNQFIKICICSKKMVSDLIDKGCVPCKSLILEFPNNRQVPVYLLNHFIRGYFDGDGCLSHSSGYQKRNDRKNGKLYAYDKWFLKFVGTQSMMNGIADYLSMNNKLYCPSKGKNHFSLKCGGNKIVKEKLSLLYKDATIFLNRKYNKYQELMNQ